MGAGWPGGRGRLVWGHLDAVLGIVLVLAGTLKGRQLLADPSWEGGLGFPRELLLGTAAFELAFGCWLLIGLYRCLTRWLALAWFTGLAAVALAQALGGAPACPCLGELQTYPLVVFAFDVAAVAALGWWAPKDRPSRRLLPAALLLSLLPAVVLLGLDRHYSKPTLFAEIDLGDLTQGEKKQQKFHLVNDSGSLLEVAAVETSCPCAGIGLEQPTVPPAQALAGIVTLDLARRPEFVGDLVLEARGLTRHGRVAFVLLLRARVHPPSQAGGRMKGTN